MLPADALTLPWRPLYELLVKKHKGKMRSSPVPPSRYAAVCRERHDGVSCAHVRSEHACAAHPRLPRSHTHTLCPILPFLTATPKRSSRLLALLGGVYLRRLARPCSPLFAPFPVCDHHTSSLGDDDAASLVSFLCLFPCSFSRRFTSDVSSARRQRLTSLPYSPSGSFRAGAPPRFWRRCALCCVRSTRPSSTQWPTCPSSCPPTPSASHNDHGCGAALATWSRPHFP